MSDEVKERLRAYVSHELLLQEDGALLADDEDLLPQIDSMAIMQLVSFIEDEFGVVLDYKDLAAEHFRTLASIERLVERKVGTP